MRWILATLLAGFLLASDADAQREPFSTVPTEHWVYNALSEAGCEAAVAELTRYEVALRVAKRINGVVSGGPVPADATQRRALQKLAAELHSELAQLGIDLQAITSLRSGSTASSGLAAKGDGPSGSSLSAQGRSWGPVVPTDGFALGFELDDADLPGLSLDLNRNRPTAWQLDLTDAGGLAPQFVAPLSGAAGALGYRPSGLALSGYLGDTGLSAQVAVPNGSGVAPETKGLSNPDYSFGANVPLGFLDGSLGTKYARVTDLYGTSRDSVVTTDLEVRLSDALSVSASLARAGINPFEGESSWRGELSYSPGSFTVGAGIMGVDPDFVRLGYFGPTLLDAHQPLRGVGGTIIYRGGESLTIRGGIEGYGVESDADFSFRRYQAGVGYTLNQRLALEFTMARLETMGERDLTSTYATVGVGVNLTPDASFKLLYRVLDLQEDPGDARSASSVVATQFSVQF